MRSYDESRHDTRRASSTSRKVTDAGLTDQEREEIIRSCLAAGGHFTTFDPTTPNQYGRCVRCNAFVRD